VPRKVSIPFNAGSKEKIASKHAPFGVLKLGKNLRHRELGGLGMRNGYVPVGQTTLTGTLVAHDLFEYQGRLCALGSDQGEGYPSAVFEFTNLANAKWRCSGHPAGVSPFTNAREVAGVPQLEGGVDRADAVSGGGYTLLVYHASGNDHSYALIVDSRTNQTVHFEDLTNGVAFAGIITLERAAFAGGKFFIQASKVSDNSLLIAQFTVGTSSAFTSFATVDGANANLVTAQDLVAVTHNTTALLCSAFDRGAATDLNIKVYQSNGAQLGGTIAVAGTTAVRIALDADQADNTILLGASTSVASSITTFNFAGGVVAGPTAITHGGRMSVARRSPGVGSDLAFIAVKSTNDTVIQSLAVDTLPAPTTVQTLFNVNPVTRLFNLQGPTPSLVIGGLIGASGPQTSALFHVGNSTMHAMTRDYLVAADPASGFLQPTLTYDSTVGSLAWLSMHKTDGALAVFFPSVTLVDYRSTARAQNVSYGGLQYFSSGTPWVYDGRAATEIGFLEPPVITSAVTAVGAGALTPGARYTWTAHWSVEFADGSFIESAPSLPVTRTMGAADNQATITVTGPHSLHTVLGSSSLGASVTLVISRTEWSPTTVDPTTGVPGVPFSQLRRSVQSDLDADVTTYGQSSAVVDTTSDATLATRGVIYTQGDRGEFSASVEHDAPESCRYIAATESRLVTGGLVRPYEFQVSKEAFLGQPFAFSLLSNFYGLVDSTVRGVYALDGVKLIFTRNDIYGVRGEDPDDEGKGVVGSPSRIPSPSGLVDWRSFLEEQGGLWCQLDDDKLFRMPRGAGAPEWLGQDVQKTMQSFPVISATARHKADHVALFAASNAALTDARILCRDMLFETWLFDSPPLQSSKGIEALTVFGRTAAYVSGGVVYQQTPGLFVDNTSTFIDLEALTQPIYPFGIGGDGEIHDAMLTCEYRGDCVLGFRVSYDDGKTFTTLASFTITGLTAGATVQKRWALPRIVTDSVVFDITVTSNGAPTEGLVLNELDLLVTDESGMPELDPQDCA